MELVAPVCNWMLRRMLWLLADYQVFGRQQVPKTGPCIVVANHQSNMDPPFLGASLGRPARFLAKASLFTNPISTAFFRGYGAYPVRRDGTDLASTRWALRQLRQGYALVIFPEGSRSPGRMKRAEPGVAYLALVSRAPILPVAITGTEGLGPMWRVFLPTGRITVTFGEPFTLASENQRAARERLQEMADGILARVALLLPEQYRGFYATATARSRS